MSIVCGIWGDDKTGKSTLALTFPKPMYYAELDLGGYNRAKWKFQQEINDGLVDYHGFIAPIQAEPSFRPSKIVTGMKELWYQFLEDYVKNLLSKPEMVTGVIDTGTLLWELICTSYLQEKQELQLDAAGNAKPNENLRVSLLPIEYREPNIRMRGIIYQARARDKNLVIIHHSRDEYKPMPNPKTGRVEESKTGKRERSGFNSLGDSTDWMLHTYKNNGSFWCKVEAESVPAPLVGLPFEDPSYSKIMEQEGIITGASII